MLFMGILIEQCACGFGERILLRHGMGEEAMAGAGIFMSCACPNFNVALVIAGPILTLMQMTGGLFSNVQ